jgi:hypothetical protein
LSLRLRFTLGFVALLVAGLAAFGVATYSLYAPTLYSRLQYQLRSSVSTACDELQDYNHVPHPGGGGVIRNPGRSGPVGPPPEQGSPTVVLPPGTYAVLRTPAGRTLTPITFGTANVRPDLPAHFSGHPNADNFFTVGSVKGPTTWQVLWTAAPELPGYTVALAAPTTGVMAGLRSLVLVEAGSAAALLAILLTIS